MTTTIDKLLANMASRHTKSAMGQSSPSAVTRGKANPTRIPPIAPANVADTMKGGGASVPRASKSSRSTPAPSSNFGHRMAAHRKANPIKIKPANKGKLHAKLGVPQDKPIPAAKIEKAEQSASPALRKEATFAENAKHFDHSRPSAGPTVHVHIHTTPSEY